MTAKKIGLALSGGGARGFSHVGVLKVLAEYNIRIDMVAGTSAGSIVGAAFATGMTVSEIEEMASKVRWTNMTRPSLSPLGLLSNAPMGRFLKDYFRVATFEELSIPFAAVCCDFDTGKQKIMKHSGDLEYAVRASCAVPGIFTPISGADGRLLVDGGVVAPVPTDAVREMGADVIIAVDLMACGATFRTRPRTGIGMMFQSAMALLRAASRNQTYQADIVIEPQIAHLRPDEISKRTQFIALGEAAVREKMGEILELVS